MRILVFLLLMQSVDHQRGHRSDVTPMSLTEIEDASLANNLEIRLMEERVKQAKAGVTTAGVLQDPSFMYRNWGAPLLQPWDLNRSQNMFMFSQTIPGSGKRELSYIAADQAVEIAEAELEAKKLDVTARVRAAF